MATSKNESMTQQEFFNRFTYSVRTDKIGGGGFGNVYRAYDNTLHREVAIKVSEVKTTNDGQKTFSLKDEFEALAHVPKHPNIANYEEFYSFESPQGVFDYAVMQYYPSGNLTDAIRQGLTLEQKEEVARQLMEGIGFLHAHQVVHRDLKPGNILIVRHGGKVIPLITDFGLSKAANTGDGSMFSNSFGGGTQRYSSPEQLQGKPLRFNTDLWSFGAILYELFMGEQLFTASSGAADTAAAELEIYNKIIHGDVRALNGLPEKWRRVAERCLVVNPEQRAKSVEELRTMVDIQGAFSHNAGGSVPTPPIDSEETVVGGVAAMGVKDEETVADMPAATIRVAATENPSAQPRSRKRRVWPWVLAAVAVALVAILAMRGCGGKKSADENGGQTAVADTIMQQMDSLVEAEEAAPATEEAEKPEVEVPDVAPTPAPVQPAAPTAPAKPVPAGYVDLGLSVYWKASNEWNSSDDHGFYTYDEAKSRFGSKLPTEAQYQELLNKCTWKWNGNGYKVTGPNGQSITLPAAGIRHCVVGEVGRVGSIGYYWSSTPNGSEYAWDLLFFSGSHFMNSDGRCLGQSVRLVQGK